MRRVVDPSTLSLLILTSALLFSFSSFTGLIYDGGLYASLGYWLKEKGEYSFNFTPGDVPPFLPVMIAFSLFILGGQGYRYVSPFFSVLGIIALYLLVKERANREEALLCTLIFLFNPVFLEIGTNVTADSVIFSLTLLAALTMYKLRDSFFKHVLFGSLISCAFLTKYNALLFASPFLVSYVSKNGRRSVLSLLSFIIIALPWVLWSQTVWGTPLKTHSAYLLRYILAEPEKYVKVIIPRFIEYVSPTLLLFSLTNVIVRVRENGLKKTFRDEWIYVFLIPIAAVSFWKDKEIRYLMTSFAAASLLSAVFISRIPQAYRKIGILALLLTLFTQAWIGLRITWGCAHSFVLLEEAGKWLKNNSKPCSIVLTQSYRQIHFYSHRKTYQFPRNMERIERFIEEKNVSYIVIDSYEKTTPPWAYEKVQKYPLIAFFKDEYGEVKIYKVKGG